MSATEGPAERIVRVELFGAPRLLIGGERVQPGKKAIALIAWLAAHPGQDFARERLAALLWPDRFDEQARQSLRQALTALRRPMGEAGESVLTTTEGRIGADPDALNSDVADFDRLRQSADVDGLIAAAALCRSGFLEQLGPVGEEFDSWASAERQRRRAQAVAVLEQIISRRQADGRAADALAFAERLVEVDPAHEPGHRALMSLYAALGHRSAALRQFEAARRALAEHLDAEPDGRTAALYETIRSSPAGPEPAPLPPRAAAQRASSAPIKLRPFWLLRFVRRRRLMVGGAALAALAAVAWTARPMMRPAPDAASVAAFSTEDDLCLDGSAASTEPTLIVLPVRLFDEDAGTAFFAAAATDRIQSIAGVISGVAVVAGPPAGHPDLALSATEIAAKTGATHVLDGSVRVARGQLAVTLRLIDGRGGRQLWQSTRRLALPLADPASAQDELAILATQGVQEQLTDGRQALAYPRYEPASIEVWELNTRGFAALSELDPVANELARDAFEAALAISPQNAGANAGMAFTHLSPVLFRWTSDVDAEEAAARRYAQAALQADPEFTAALHAMSVLALLDGDHDQAVAWGEEALRLSGGGADSTAFLAYVLSYTQDRARGVELARRAMRLRPYATPVWYQWNLARALRLDGDLDAAIACLSRIDYGAAGVVAPALELALAYEAAGRRVEAARMTELVMAQTSGRFSSAAYCAHPPYADQTAGQACAAALTAAGLPR